jgi:hypothetical protein
MERKGFQRFAGVLHFPREGSIAVNMHDVKNLAITLATNIRMRAVGELKFSMTYGEVDEAPVEVIHFIETQLSAIAKSKGRSE